MQIRYMKNKYSILALKLFNHVLIAKINYKIIKYITKQITIFQ